MQGFLLLLATSISALASPTESFIDAAGEKHGAFGGKAAHFLVEHMPEKDREVLSADFLIKNLDLAMRARETFPWAKDVPEEIFLNDVLPYAVFDEPRDPWRADFLGKATPIVQGAKTANEAAQRLSKEFFGLIKTHYHSGRLRPNQSPKESIMQGKATCTGLSIILVDACRAVGIPARAVGTPMWSSGRGNHTWVEVWDGGWHFTGADEYDKDGLNRGWFTGDAAMAQADQPMHAIYATSWSSDEAFPMVWSPGSTAVGGVNVTGRYAKATGTKPTLGIRFFDGDQRMPVTGFLASESGKFLKSFRTKAGTADMNDMPHVGVTLGTRYRLRFLVDGDVLETAPITAIEGEATIDARRAELKKLASEDSLEVTAENADDLIEITFTRLAAEQHDARAAELAARKINLGDKTMRWLEKTFGEAPDDGRSLWISMHGGGGAPALVNDQQWQNQIQLYEPPEGIYVAPRAPTDTWNLWHEGHIDPMFSRLIEDMIALRDVNPDKVYLMGYSAGGDGVWQLAPRMADRFAAASMMAGHPNEAQLDSLRNLPFAIFMGGADAAYDRNKIAAERTKQLDALHKTDPGGYVHLSRIYPGLPHWMDRKDAESVPWMAKFTRNPWPKKIVWLQDDVTHDRFYWLRLPDDGARKDQRIIATVDGQKIHLLGDVPEGTRLLLNDALLDLDQPVEVIVNDQPAHKFEVARSLKVIRTALADRLDPKSCPTAEIVLN